MSTGVADLILNQCGPRIMNVSNVCDGSLTKLEMQGLTPATLESMKQTAWMEYFLYTQAVKARMTGVRENSLYDLILSRTAPIKLGKETVNNKSYFLPYILRNQEDYINANAFVISGGSANPNAGTTVGGIAYPQSSWDVIVENTPHIGSPLIHIERYFVLGAYVVVLNLSAAGAVQEPYMKVIHTEHVHTGDGVEKARVTLAANVTDAASGWGGMTAAERILYQPTRGVVQVGVNNVSDYESWCEMQPVDLSNRLIHFWCQTSRFVFCYDDETKKYLAYIMAGNVNPYLDLYKELPLTEQNRKAYANWERQQVISFFYGQQIDEHQTAEDYRNLPRVYDPVHGIFLEYKANALGVKTLLNECNRVIDYAGQPLDLNVLENQLYQIKRHREVDGGTVTEIDAWTNRNAAALIDSLMMGYYKARNRMDYRQDWKPQQISVQDKVLWNYRSYEFRNAQVVLNVIVEPFFDDHKLHFPAAIASRGNMLLIPDWSDIKRGVAGAASRTSHTPDLETDPDFACIIKANIKHYEMQSFVWTVLLEDPARHLWLENFSDECPTYEYTLCEPTQVS